MPYDTSNYWTGQGAAKKKETQQGGDILTGTVGPDTTQGTGGNGTVLNGSTITPPAFTAGQGGDAARSGGRFVNFGTWFDLNKDAAARQANQLGDVAESAGNKSYAGLQSIKTKFTDGINSAQKYGGETINDTGQTTLPNGWKMATKGNQVGTNWGQQPGSTPIGTTGWSMQTGTAGGLAMQGGDPSLATQNAPLYSGGGLSTPGAGELTRDQMAAKAANGFTGATSLEEQAGPTSWAGMLAGARSAAQGAKQLGTDTGRQAAIDQYYKNTGSFTGSGGGTSGNSRLDAALTGVAGQDRFNSLGQKFGGLENAFKGENDASKQVGADAKSSAEFASQQYGNDVKVYDKAAADKAAADAAAKAPPVFTGNQIDETGVIASIPDNIDFKGNNDYARNTFEKSVGMSMPDAQKFWKFYRAESEKNDPGFDVSKNASTGFKSGTENSKDWLANAAALYKRWRGMGKP